ncbi:MAG TPA: acyl-CoA transferase [Rhodospirillales bacterium]|nr:acyl-CoA transferase [Rhodospirillales bacterium]
MSSKPEQVLEAIKALLITAPDAKIERNTAMPEKIPPGGLIVLRDGDPGDPEIALGGFGNVYCCHNIEIELYIEDGDTTTRDVAFDTLVQSIGTALESDLTLGGLAFGMSYGRPEIDTEAVAGAAAIRTGTIILTVEYETNSLLG